MGFLSLDWIGLCEFNLHNEGSFVIMKSKTESGRIEARNASSRVSAPAYVVWAGNAAIY
jgi:hypothetical protein